MTIKDLIRLLKTCPKDAQVGTIGHFGEFFPMDEIEFQIRKARISTESQKTIEVLDICCPDIGPEPD